jgi:hypothetical protein
LQSRNRGFIIKNGLSKGDKGGFCVQLAERTEAAARNDHKNLPKLRKDLYTPGKRPALAGLLPGMPGEEAGVRDDFQNVPGLRERLFVFRNAETMAEILPGMS